MDDLNSFYLKLCKNNHVTELNPDQFDLPIVAHGGLHIETTLVNNTKNKGVVN